MTKRLTLAWMAFLPCVLLAQEETGKTIVLSEEQATDAKPAAAERVLAQPPSEGQVVVVAEGSVLDAAHAVVAQVPGRVLSQDLLDEAEAATIRATNNVFATGGKAIAWQKALGEVLRPVSLRYFDDGTVVKIGSSLRVDALYAALEVDRLAANHSRIEVNFAGGTPISAALRVIQRLGSINMNFDYMKAEHRGVAAQVATVAEPKDGQTVTVQAAPPEVQTTYATPEGQQVEWRAVLKEVLDPIGYTFIEDNGTVKPMPVEQLVKFNQAKVNAKPLATRIVKINHANAEIIVEKLKKMNLLKHDKGFMDITFGKDDNAKTYKGSSGGQMQSGSSGQQMGAQTTGGGAAFSQLNRPRTPQGIILADVEENLPVIEKQIKLLDTRERQVLIEALILSLSDNMKKELGVKWGDLKLSYNSQFPYNVPQSYYQYDDDGNILMKDITELGITRQVPDLIQRMPVAGDMINLENWNGKITDNRFGVTPISFDAVIKMIEGDSFSRNLGNPVITVGDHGEAIIQIASILPVEQSVLNYAGGANGSVSSVGNTTEWLSLQTGTTLWVSPEISENGDFVRLSVHPQIVTPVGVVYASKKEGQSDKLEDREKNYELSSQELDTRVSVRTGETILLGGLMESKQVDTVSKVPLLGDIPYLGRLFSYKGTERRQAHLVLLIRPTVLDEDNPNTGFEDPSLKIAEPMLKGIGKTLAPNKGEDPLVAKEKSLLEKMGWRKKEEEEAELVEAPGESSAAPVNHGSTDAEAAGK